jgi:cytochrome c oxidase subunit III
MTTTAQAEPRAPVVDASALPERAGILHEPLYLGFIGLITIEVIVFATMVASYFYLASTAREWPPFGVDEPKLLLPTLNTVVLVVSAWLVHLADKGLRDGKVRRMKVGIGAGAVLAALFLVIKAVEYAQDVHYRWDTHSYGSIVWTISGFHAAHVLSLILKTIVVEILALRNYFTPTRSIGVQVNGLYFIFVALIWLPLYAVLYFAPRFLS